MTNNKTYTDEAYISRNRPFPNLGGGIPKVCMKTYHIKLVVPHNNTELVSTYLNAGYKQTWVSFEGVTLIKTKKSKKGGRK